jgi:hypothetical protein
VFEDRDAIVVGPVVTCGAAIRCGTDGDPLVWPARVQEACVATTAAFSPTHIAPPGGLPTWADANPNQPTARIDAGLEVQVTERRRDWARILCSNGGTAWFMRTM